ncbi:MAG: hypothetical protein ACLR2G_05090 [Phascolarctobacterium faecium]
MSEDFYIYIMLFAIENLGGKVLNQPCLPLYLWIAGPAEQTFLMCLNKQSPFSSFNVPSASPIVLPVLIESAFRNYFARSSSGKVIHLQVKRSYAVLFADAAVRAQR